MRATCAPTYCAPRKRSDATPQNYPPNFFPYTELSCHRWCDFIQVYSSIHDRTTPHYPLIISIHDRTGYLLFILMIGQQSCIQALFILFKTCPGRDLDHTTWDLSDVAKTFPIDQSNGGDFDGEGLVELMARAEQKMCARDAQKVHCTVAG